MKWPVRVVQLHAVSASIIMTVGRTWCTNDYDYSSHILHAVRCYDFHGQ